MPNTEGRIRFAFDRPGNYRVRVLGYLDESWSERLGGLRITESSLKDDEGPITELVGKVRDQAELMGVFDTLYNLHLPILSVECLKDD